MAHIVVDQGSDSGVGNHWGDNRLGHDRVYNRWGHWGKVVDSRVTSVGDGLVGNSLVVDRLMISLTNAGFSDY